jgi:HJR/Mrr/RecB family endonuclease
METYIMIFFRKNKEKSPGNPKEIAEWKRLIEADPSIVERGELLAKLSSRFTSELLTKFSNLFDEADVEEKGWPDNVLPYYFLQYTDQYSLPAVLFFGTDHLDTVFDHHLGLYMAELKKLRLHFFEHLYSVYDSAVHHWNCENLIQQNLVFNLILNPNGRLAQATNQKDMELMKESSDAQDKELQAKSAEIGEYERSVAFIVYYLLRQPNQTELPEHLKSSDLLDSLEKPLSVLENVKVSFTDMYELFSLTFNYDSFKKYVIQFLNKYESIKEIFESPLDAANITGSPLESKHKLFFKEYHTLCELAGREFNISPRILNFFLVFEYHLIKHRQREDTITRISNVSKSKTECIQEFLDEYPENWKYETSTLERIFQKNSIEFTDVTDDLHQFQKTAHLKKLKDTLLSDIPNYTLDDLDLLDGIQFEEFLAKLYTEMGYTAEVTKSSGDQGGDLIISKGSKKTVVQAKRYSDKVANSAVQEAVTAIRHYDCDNAMVVTTNYFTKSAIELASSNDVTLTDRDDLEELLEEYPIPNSND